jgi:hypothetical protein
MKLGLHVFSLFLCFSAHVTVVQIDVLPDMAANADVIAHVVVGEKVSKTDKMGRSVQLSTVEVIQGIKGVKTGQLLTIYQVDGIVGQSQYAFGEEFVLFGMKYKDMVVSYGVGLGKFKVLRTQKSAAVVEPISVANWVYCWHSRIAESALATCPHRA